MVMIHYKNANHAHLFDICAHSFIGEAPEAVVLGCELIDV